jgi:hypothetical protein
MNMNRKSATKKTQARGSKSIGDLRCCHQHHCSNKPEPLRGKNNQVMPLSSRLIRASQQLQEQISKSMRGHVKEWGGRGGTLLSLSAMRAALHCNTRHINSQLALGKKIFVACR